MGHHRPTLTLEGRAEHSPTSDEVCSQESSSIAQVIP